MKKIDIYRVRTIFEMIRNNINNDRNNPSQKEKSEEYIQEGIDLCNVYINKMNPLKR